MQQMETLHNALYLGIVQLMQLAFTSTISSDKSIKTEKLCSGKLQRSQVSLQGQNKGDTHISEKEMLSAYREMDCSTVKCRDQTKRFVKNTKKDFLLYDRVFKKLKKSDS